MYPYSAMPGRPVSKMWFVGLFMGLFGFMAALGALWMGMRGVLDLGGFVATGGPYEIAHPAPEWVLLVPVSIWCGWAFGGLMFAATRRLEAPSPIPLIWSSVFLSLGYNFAEYGVRPPGGDGLQWGWILCAVVFVGMGAVTVPSLVRGFIELRGRGTAFITAYVLAHVVGDPRRRGRRPCGVLAGRVLTAGDR